MASTNFKVKNGLEIQAGTLVVSNGAGSSGQVLKSTGTGVEWGTGSSGSGDVVGPASSTDNAIVRFDSTTGKLIQNSTATLSDGGIMIVTELDTDSIKSATANSPIVIAPDGTGDVHLNADSVRIGDNNANATIATNGTGDLIITTNEGSSNEGIVRLYDGLNGDITLTPNGSGQVKVGTDQVVTLVASQTLTNKTISGSSNTLSNIANASLTNSTISGVALGSNLNALTISSPLTGTSFNGSSAVSIGIPVATTSVSGYLSSTDWTTFNNKGNGTVTSVTGGTYLTGGTITTSGTLAVDATSANTASKVVARDASGNFSAGTITANLTGNASGSSGSATYAGYLNTTNQGLTGSTGLTTVSSTTAWSNYPIGYSAMFTAGQTATGAPSSNYGFFIKIANRDAGGGWGGIWSDYSGGDTYVGNTTVSSSYATWYKLLSSTNYNSYAPTLTGTGASGTWGISISGNSATATSAATLTTARTINTTSFNGSADITIGSKSNIGTPSAQGTNYYGTIYVSQTATPTGGSTGDLYLVY